MSYNYYCNDCGCWFPSERRRTNCVSCGSEEIVDTDEADEEDENSSDNVETDKADYYWEEYIADMDLIGMMTKPIEEEEEDGV